MTTNKSNSKRPQSPFGGATAGGNKNKPKFSFTYIYILIGIFLIVYYMMSMGTSRALEVADTEFNQMVKNREIDHVEYVRKNEN